MALPPPDLNIPLSSNTVEISIINTTATIRGVDAWKFLQPPIKGHDWLAVPCFSILIHHPLQDRTLVFDLGIRKDWWNYAPSLQARFKAGGYRIEVKKGVREILEEKRGDGRSVDTSKIEAVVWSHWHFDHIGDPSTFDPSTALIVGPGFKDKFLPGYPSNPTSTILEADYAGRELRELDFTDSEVTIGRFKALDYFSDGSFYFLDAPGHAVGHICGFARVKTHSAGVVGKDSFVFLGGDAAHHGGELRPSVYLPLPNSILPHPFTTTGNDADDTLFASLPFCPGSLFDAILPTDSTDSSDLSPMYQQAFYKPSTQFGIQHDAEEAERTIAKLQEVDVADNVLVVLAHDEALLDVVDLYPARANDFVEKGWVRKCRWRFLRDFAGVVGWPEDLVAGKRDWSRPSGGENDNAL